MLSTNNVLFPANGDPANVPSQDMVLGLYWMHPRPRQRAMAKACSSRTSDEVRRALSAGIVTLQTRCTVRVKEYDLNRETGETTRTHDPCTKRLSGRALLSEILPKGMKFSDINKTLKKKEIARLISTCFRVCGLRATVDLC